jgi:hypothetical protein
MQVKFILLLISATFLVFPVCSGQDARYEDTIHKVILNPGLTAGKKPGDMLQRNCSDCHAGNIYSAYLYRLLLDTIKSKEKMIHSWLSCTANDSLKEIDIRARGINNFNDTLPAKNAMGLVYVQRYFGRELISSEPFFTNDSGMAKFLVPEGITGDTTGYVRLIIKLADEKSYPNARLKIRRKWGKTIAKAEPLDSVKIFSGGNILPQWISIFFTGSVLTVCIIIGYILYLIKKIKETGKHLNH